MKPGSLLLGTTLVLCSAAADVAQLSPIRDTTIYSGSAVLNSNGGGATCSVGSNNLSEIRRALMLFDLSVIPRGAFVESVSLRLSLAKAPTDDSDRAVSLFRSNVSWGETQLSNAGTGHGTGYGAPAAPGDATWIFPFYGQTPTWGGEGGNFTQYPSATSLVASTPNDFTWTGPGMVDDLRAWVADPSTNFGWVIRGDETNNRSTRQFFTREAPSTSLVPLLTVTYSPPLPRFAEIKVVEDAVVLTWNSQPGIVYQVQSSTDLLESSWLDLQPAVTAIGTVTQWSESRVSLPANRFYRLKALYAR